MPNLERTTLHWPADEVFSVEVLGTLTLPENARNLRWLITCDARGGSYFLWLDDHMVCEGSNGQPRWNPYRLESVLPFNHTLAVRQAVGGTPGAAGGKGDTAGGGGADLPVRYFLRATFVRQRQHILASPHEKPYMELRWQRSASMPEYVWGKNMWQPAEGRSAAPPVPVPRASLSTFVPTAQSARLTMQRELLMGYYGTWSERSVTAHTMLPFGVEVRLGLCTLGGPSRRCILEGTKQMVDDGLIRLGHHATDHSYTRLHFAMTVDGRGQVAAPASRGGGGGGGGGDGGGRVGVGRGGSSSGDGPLTLNVSLETAQRGRWGPLLILARVVGGSSGRALALASQATLLVSVGFAGSVEGTGAAAAAGTTGSGNGAFSGAPGWLLSGRTTQARGSAASASHAARADVGAPDLTIVTAADGQWRRQAAGALSDLGGLSVRAASGANASRVQTLSLVPTPHLALRLLPTSGVGDPDAAEGSVEGSAGGSAGGSRRRQGWWWRNPRRRCLGESLPARRALSAGHLEWSGCGAPIIGERAPVAGEGGC